jgi:hypothetical protein
MIENNNKSIPQMQYFLSDAGQPEMGIYNKDDLTKLQASAQLSLQAQQNVKAQMKEILMQSREL